MPTLTCPFLRTEFLFVCSFICYARVRDWILKSCQTHRITSGHMLVDRWNLTFKMMSVTYSYYGRTCQWETCAVCQRGRQWMWRGLPWWPGSRWAPQPPAHPCTGWTHPRTDVATPWTWPRGPCPSGAGNPAMAGRGRGSSCGQPPQQGQDWHTNSKQHHGVQLTYLCCASWAFQNIPS